MRSRAASRYFSAGSRTRPITGRLPWLRIIAWSLIGCAVAAWLVLSNLPKQAGLDALVTPGRSGPAVVAIHHDLPKLAVPKGEGGDGQLYYAIARQPMHLSRVAPDLKWPHYWLQRPFFPVLAWMVHPSGGGHGLVLAMLAVGLAGLLLAGLAAGALSATLGGPAWFAVVVPLVPGSWLTLRASSPDTLAIGLVLAAIALSMRGHDRWAVVTAIAAVLTRETSLLVLVGFALWRRDRNGAILAGVPAMVALGWAAMLRLAVPGAAYPPNFAFPGDGLVHAARLWLSGRDLFGLAAVASAAVVGALAMVRRGILHPLGVVVALQLVMTGLLAPMPMTMTSIARVVEPLLVIGLLAIVTPWAQFEAARAWACDLARSLHPAGRVWDSANLPMTEIARRDAMESNV